MTDKLIVSNRGALRRKYGASGLARIGSALTRLIAADKKRGLTTRVLYLDDTRAMRARHATVVADPDDYAATKAAIDAVFRAESPDYLMIVGAPDVVAHQPLRNPLLAPPDEPDRYAWSDLPYACDGPYSDDTAAFTGPTRVVGRLPDLRGATRAAEASHLIRLLRTAATYKSREPEDYATHFALSAKTWTVSSQRNLFAIFGRSDRLRTSPPSGPGFGTATGAAHAHFINCHGSEGSPEFQGQHGKTYPIALSTRSIDGHIAPGTVAAAECCYGAQLYSAGLIGVDIPICQSYLAQGAYGYFGSTTIAYGDARRTVAADLMVQYFLLEIQDGASLGRAVLHARQRYVRENVDLDPTDLKTLAQFILLGDPAVHPVRRDAPASVVAKAAGDEARRTRRHERRAKLAGDGEFLQASRPTASQAAPMPPLTTSVRRALSAIAKDAGLCTPQRFRMFPLQEPVAPAGKRSTRTQGRSMKALKAATSTTRRRYFVAIEKPPGAGGGPRAIAVVVKEIDGRIVDVRKYGQR